MTPSYTYTNELLLLLQLASTCLLTCNVKGRSNLEMVNSISSWWNHTSATTENWLLKSYHFLKKCLCKRYLLEWFMRSLYSFGIAVLGWMFSRHVTRWQPLQLQMSLRDRSDQVRLDELGVMKWYVTLLYNNNSN